MDYTNTMKVMQGRYQLSYERTCGGLCQSLLFEVISHVREELTSIGYLCHQTVEVVGLHRLIETDNVRMAKPPHELSFTQEILTNILLLDLVSFNYLDCHLCMEYSERERDWLI